MVAASSAELRWSVSQSATYSELVVAAQQQPIASQCMTLFWNVMLHLDKSVLLHGSRHVSTQTGLLRRGFKMGGIEHENHGGPFSNPLLLVNNFLNSTCCYCITQPASVRLRVWSLLQSDQIITLTSIKFSPPPRYSTDVLLPMVY